MLRNTFCHLPSINGRTERRLWDAGISTWQELLHVPSQADCKLPEAEVRDALKKSMEAADACVIRYFADVLPPSEHWRLFGEFREKAVYLDIETTGMGRGIDHITTIVAYDGLEARHFVYGKNLNDFPAYFRNFDLVVTYNGKSFDLPFIRRHFQINADPVHLDLRYILRSVGIAGGLKKCEKQLGMDRNELDDVDGYIAVLLWQEHVRRKSTTALETLLAYNYLDVINLEPLMITAYNRKVAQTPFAATHTLALPQWQPANPFAADTVLLDRLRGQAARFR